MPESNYDNAVLFRLYRFVDVPARREVWKKVGHGSSVPLDAAVSVLVRLPMRTLVGKKTHLVWQIQEEQLSGLIRREPSVTQISPSSASSCSTNPAITAAVPAPPPQPATHTWLSNYPVVPGQPPTPLFTLYNRRTLSTRLAVPPHIDEVRLAAARQRRGDPS